MHPANTPLGRFGMSTLVDSPDPFVGAMPLAGLVNPLTGTPTLGPLAVLVDFVAGLVNHYRRAPDEWTVSSELSVELTPDALSVVQREPDVEVVGHARPFGTRGATSLASATSGTETPLSAPGQCVRCTSAFPVSSRSTLRPACGDARPTDLADMMALRGGRAAITLSPVGRTRSSTTAWALCMAESPLPDWNWSPRPR